MVDSLQQSFLNKSRKDKFLLVFNLPKAFKKVYPKITERELQISVYSSPVPSVSVPAIDQNYAGQTLRVTSQTRSPYTPLTINFTIDNEFKNYWILWQWLNLMNDSEQSRMNEYFEKYNKIVETVPLKQLPVTSIVNKDQGESVYFDYMVNMSIFGLDEYNNKRIEFVYINAFITDLAEMQYSYRDSEEIESSATFAFSQMQVKLLSEC